MKLKRPFAAPLYASVKSRLSWRKKNDAGTEQLRSRGEGLARLHEYQHRMILGLFKINIAALMAFLSIVASFTLLAYSKPDVPLWMVLMLLGIAIMLLLGCYSTVRELKDYRGHYNLLMAQLQDRLQQYFSRLQPDQGGERRESRVLSLLKPKEHKGWDSKDCVHCRKSLELMASVCLHCGYEQETLLKN